MTSYVQWTQWLCEAWLSSIVRALTVGGIAIALFCTIDRCCRSLSAMQRSWLWRLLFVKLALLLVCSYTFLPLPITSLYLPNVGPLDNEPLSALAIPVGRLDKVEPNIVGQPRLLHFTSAARQFPRIGQPRSRIAR